MLAKCAKLSWQLFFFAFFFGRPGSPSLVFAAKIAHLLHFVAKISHSHCSSIFPLVLDFSMVFIELSIVFIGLSMIFFNLSMVLFNFSMVFFNCSMVFFDCSMVFFHFLMVFFNLSMSSICAWLSFSFHLFSLIVPKFSLINTWFFFRSFHFFWKYTMCKL